jgi:ubiquinone/menaquinone biosynthesis C-methylase UbiE
MRKDASKIKTYWSNRADSDSSVQSTTMDLWLRDIETKFLLIAIKKYDPKKICDVGCGDGITTIRCAEENPSMTFVGHDYSASMIKNAVSNNERLDLKNIRFYVADITEESDIKDFDFIYTTRCLINLTDWDSQASAIAHIHNSLLPGGIYVMIENFVEGHDLFNSMREKFNLSPIPIRDHNTFFEREKLINFLNDKFDILEEVNISSTYYLMTRIIYSSICVVEGLNPNYKDIHHQLAAKLPFSGEYGPVRALILRKRG